MPRIPTGLSIAALSGGLLLLACSADPSPGNPGGSAGSGVPAGSGGSTGSGGPAGSGGSTGPGGSAGSGGSGAAPGGGASATGDMPCDVGAIVRNRCAGCHQTPPLFGAPMALLNVDHFQQPAKNAQKVWEVARTRVDVGTMPPSTAPQLSAGEKSALLAWLGQGAPAVTGSNCAALPPPAAPVVEPRLSCTPTHTFVSQGSNAADGLRRAHPAEPLPVLQPAGAVRGPGAGDRVGADHRRSAGGAPLDPVRGEGHVQQLQPAEALRGRLGPGRGHPEDAAPTSAWSCPTATNGCCWRCTTTTRRW